MWKYEKIAILIFYLQFASATEKKWISNAEIKKAKVPAEALAI